MPAARSFAKNGDVVATPSSHVWVVSEPGFAAEVGTTVVLYRDCVVIGDRGLRVPAEDEFDTPIPIQRIHIDDQPDYLAARIASFKSLSVEPSPDNGPEPKRKPLRERLGMAPDASPADAPVTKLDSPAKADVEDASGST